MSNLPLKVSLNPKQKGRTQIQDNLKIRIIKLSRGEICVTNFILPWEWCLSG